MKLPYLFTIAFFAGVSLYAAHFIQGWPDVYQLWAVPIVILYGLIVLFRHRDQAGSSDSIYYLGFIFTLLALFVSLLPMVVGSADINPGKILASFSVALATTLVGLIFRTFAVQFSVISETDLEDSNRMLVDATRELVITVKTITHNLEEVSGDMEKGFKHITDDLKSSSTHFSESMEETIQGVGETIRKASEDYQENLRESNEAYSSVANSMVLSIADSISACDQVVSEYKKTLSLVGGMLESLTSSNGDSYSRIEAEIGNLSDKVYQATTAISDNIQELSIQTVEKVSDKMQEQLTSFQGGLPNMDRVVIALSKTVETVNQYNNSLGKMLEMAEGRIGASADALSSLVDYGTAIGDLSSNVSSFSESSQRLKILLSDFTADFEQVKGINIELNKLVVDNSQTVIREIKKEMQR